MYVSYLLDKDTSMYPGSARCTSNNLPVQNFVSAPAYPDYLGYHPVPGLDSHGQAAPAWGSHYGPQREDWSAYGPGPSSAGPAAHINASSPGQGSYSSADYSSLHPAAAAAPLPPVDTIHAQQISPNSQRHSSYEWMRKTVQSTSTGRRARRFWDEKRGFFCLLWCPCGGFARFPVLREDPDCSEGFILLAVKIWFQNRRAKERKLMKKKMTHFDGSSLGSLQSDSGSVSPMPVPEAQTHSELAGSLFPAPPGPAALAMGGLQHGGSLQQAVASQ
uniref:Homeobox domain-containing protein n=1 Tax=Cyanoderma ruficeps TaxID=181631 RepID=A0A8C3P4S1_9PASS